MKKLCHLAQREASCVPALTAMVLISALTKPATNSYCKCILSYMFALYCMVTYRVRVHGCMSLGRCWCLLKMFDVSAESSEACCNMRLFRNVFISRIMGKLLQVVSAWGFGWQPELYSVFLFFPSSMRTF